MIILYMVFYLIEPSFKYTNTLYFSQQIIISCFFLLSLITILYYFASCLINDKTSFLIILMFSLCLHLGLLFITPRTSDDIKNYVARGRVMAVYMENPFFNSLADLDPNYPPELRTKWSKTTSATGPVFLYISAGLSRLASGNLQFEMIYYRLFISLTSILTGLLIYKITNNPKSAYLYLVNPLVVFDTIINSHMESVMVSLILLGLYIIYRSRGLSSWILSLTFLSLSSLTKIFSLQILPLFVIFTITNMKSKLHKLSSIFFSLILFCSLTALVYYPFWEGIITLKRYSEVYNYSSYQSSLFIKIVIIILTFIDKPVLIPLFTNLSRLIYVALVACVYCYAIKKGVISSFEKLVYFIIISYGLFLAFALNWLMPWYYITLISFIALHYGIINNVKYVYIIVGVTIYAISGYVF